MYKFRIYEDLTRPRRNARTRFQCLPCGPRDLSSKRRLHRVAVKELNLSYYSEETTLRTTRTPYGDLISVPAQQPSQDAIRGLGAKLPASKPA